MSKQRWTWRKRIFCFFLLLLASLGFYWWLNYRYTSPPLRFSGPSSQLKQTVILPTLDTPMPEKKSAIWCASFQIAWNELRKKYENELIDIQGAERIANRLNQAAQAKEDLPVNSVYANAGVLSQGIDQVIRREMAQQFPDATLPDFHPEKNAVIAFAYLQATAKFRIPFLEKTEPSVFQDSTGKRTEVQSFGIRRKDGSTKSDLRQQVQVLFATRPSRDAQPTEYALDLDKTSESMQVVAAQIKKMDTLLSMIEYVGAKRDQFQPNVLEQQFLSAETLLIPVMHWKIDHHFSELVGREKQFLSPKNLKGLFVSEARQSLEFKLDRSGASIRSIVLFGAGSLPPRHFHFNQPFLLYLKKRGADFPFFAMWVDNAELLCLFE